MKNLLAALLALLAVLAAAAAGWWYFLRSAPVSASAYLPPDTLLYAEVPDGTQTFLRFQTSKLKHLLDQGETQGMLGLILSRCGADRFDPKTVDHLRAAGQEGLQALGGESFLAVTRFDWDAQKNPGFPGALRDLGLIAGFHGSPDQGTHVEALWRELLAAWSDSPNAATAGSATHGAVPYTYLELKESGVRICRARWREWDLVSIGEAPLADFLDRAAASVPAPSLQTAPDFRSLTGQLDSGSDVVGYVDYHRGIEAYRKTLAAVLPDVAGNGAALDGIFHQLRFMRASAYGMAFRNGDVAEQCLVAAPVAERGDLAAHFTPVALASARFTSPSTLLYTAQNLDPEVYYNQQVALFQSMRASAEQAGTPPPPNPYQAIDAQLKAQGLDLHENVLRALGPELALVVDWPEGQDLPDVVVAWAVRDPEKFAPAYDKLTRTLAPLLPMVGKVEPLVVGAYRGLSFTPNQLPIVSPTLFTGPDFFGLSLTASGARRLLAEGHPRLAPEHVHGPFPPGHSGQPYAVAYLDASSLIGRGYAAGRPFLPKYLATLSPGVDWKRQLPLESKAAPLLGTVGFAGWSEGDTLRSQIVSPEGSAFLSAIVAGAVYGAIMQRGTPPATSLAPDPRIP